MKQELINALIEAGAAKSVIETLSAAVKTDADACNVASEIRRILEKS